MNDLDLSTWFVQTNNSTLTWCSDIMDDNEHYRYRPMEAMISNRNIALHTVMHHRSHQPTY